MGSSHPKPQRPPPATPQFQDRKRRLLLVIMGLGHLEKPGFKNKIEFLVRRVCLSPI